MIIWLLLFLLVTVHAANYKLEYKNNEWVQSVGGKGQYILIGTEPTVIQWCLPAGKTLTISDSTEFPTFGISAGTQEIKYNFVFPISQGGDLQVLTNGVDAVTLYRQSNPPVVSAIAAVCPSDPGYVSLYSTRKFSHIRGRKLLSVFENEKDTININTNIWGEPHFNDEEYFLEHFSDNDLHLKLNDVSSISTHQLIDPNGVTRQKLKTGTVNIIKSPFILGNYTIKTPSLWYDNYEKPIINIKRRLEDWGAKTHKKFKLKAGEQWATVCVAVTTSTSVSLQAPNTGGCNPNQITDADGAITTTATCAGAVPAATCNTQYTITSTCKYTYTSNSGEAKETEFTGYRTVTTGSCPNVDCVGSYGSWNNCYQVDGISGGRKYRTYTITTQQAGTGQACPKENGYQEIINCVTSGPVLSTMVKDGNKDAENRPTSKVDITLSTAHAESITCAALIDGATPSINAITTASKRATASTTTSSLTTTMTISGLIDETNYDFYCSISSGMTTKIDKVVPDWFAITTNPSLSDMDATVGKCSAAWTDSASARCVALATSNTCSWGDIQNLATSGTTPAILTTNDLALTTWSFTNLSPATQYQCCCYSSHYDGTDTETAGSSTSFYTFGFYEDLNIDSKTQTSITFTFKVYVNENVVCKAYTKAQWDAGKTQNTASQTYVIASGVQVNQKTINNLNHLVQYYIECTQGTDSTSASTTTNPPTYVSQPFIASKTTTGMVVKTTIDRTEKIACSVYTSGYAEPNEAAIVAGTGATTTSGELDITANVEKSIQITGLNFGTTYDIYCALVGNTDTGGAHTKSNKLTAGTVSPSVTSQPSGSDITYHSFKISVTFSHTKMSKCVIMPADATAPTAASLSGTVSGQITSFQSNAVANVALTTSDLEVGCCGTAYDVYCGQADYNLISAAYRITTIQPTINQPIVITEGTDRIKISAVFSHENQASCVLVPRNAAAPTVTHVSTGQGAVEFSGVKAHITFTPSCVGAKVNTKCNIPQATAVWFGGGADGTQPAVNAGKLEDDQLYDAYCAQVDTEVVSNKKQVVTVKETVTNTLSVSPILFDRATYTTTYSDSGTSRCIIDFTHPEYPIIQLILEGKGRDGTAIKNTGDIAVTGGVAVTKTFLDLLDCVTYDIMCAHDDKVDTVYNGIYHETDFKTICKKITSATALVSGYTMEDGTTYPTHQIKLPLTSWSTFQVTVTFDHAYTARCIVLLKNKPTPTLTQIFAGNDGQNQPAVVAGVQSTANANTAFTTTFTGLSDNTDYDVYCAQGEEVISQQERDALVSKLLVRTVAKRITEQLSLADGYQMSNGQLTSPSDAWEQISLKIKFSHTDQIQCLVTPFGNTAPNIDQIFLKTGASGTAAALNSGVSGEYGSYTTPDQSTATGGQYYVQQFTGLEEGFKYTAYCAQAKLDDKKDLVSSFTFTMLSKTITASLALSTDNPTTGCSDGYDAGCTDASTQIKLPLSAAETVSLTITYSHDGKVRCAALIKDRLSPNNKDVQNGITLQDYESSPAQTDNTAGQQVKITFTGLKEGTYYDFFCVQDFYNIAQHSQVLRHSKLVLRTVPKVFLTEPSVSKLGVYGIELTLKTSHTGVGRCVIVPGANVATYETCFNGDGVVFSNNETFAGEQNHIITWNKGLDEYTSYKIFCCQATETTLLSQGTTFTTKESVKIIQDVEVIKITGTTATVSVGFTDYINTACLIRETASALPTETEINNGLTNTVTSVKVITRDSSDVIFFEDNGELDSWIVNGQLNPDLTLKKDRTYTFTKVTDGVTLRIVSSNDCTGCSSGEYTSIAANGVVDDIVMGKYQRWTPSNTGTFYYVSTTKSKMLGTITVEENLGHALRSSHTPSPTPTINSNSAECVYENITDMPWNQTIPTKKTDCRQPETLLWITPYENFTIRNPWREKPIGEASVEVVAYPPKRQYYTYNKNETQENAGKTYDITGLNVNTKYQAICGTKGESGIFVTSSMLEFRTLKPASSVTVSVEDSRDMATVTTSKEKSDGTKYSYLPQPLGEVTLSDNEALYIVFTTNGDAPSCDQDVGIIPGSSGKTSRIKNLETLKYKSCSELDGDAAESIYFEMACYSDWDNLEEPYSSNIALWPEYTSVPAWMPKLENGKLMKCVFKNPYTGVYQTPCEDAGHFFSVEFKNQTCTATIYGEDLLNDENCDDGGEGSDYYDCPLGTDYNSGNGGCPARSIDGFCDNACKIRCLPCPRVPEPLPFCGHNNDGTQKKWECPEINENRNQTTGICNDGCPPVCNVCPGDAVLTENLATCGIAGFDYDVGYTSLTNHPCPEGDPNKPDALIYEIDYVETKCENTCTFANDGKCDEPEGENNCDDGTDCADCGESTITNKFCPSSCLPKCESCERKPIPPDVCSPREKSCPTDRSIQYTYYNIKTPPACPDGCFPNCFECPPFVEEEDFTPCNPNVEGKVEPCGIFNQGNNQSCHGIFNTDDRECRKRTFCPIGCPTTCYNCPPVDPDIDYRPKCRQLPVDKYTTGCVKERDRITSGTTDRYCSNGADYPCHESVVGMEVEQADGILLGGFKKQRCGDGCPVSCVDCPALPDPIPSCSEDKLGNEYVAKCADLSDVSTHGCYENTSKTDDCLFGAPPVCGDGCGYRCTPCPKNVVFAKCGKYYDQPCDGDEDPHSYNDQTGEVVDTFTGGFDFLDYIGSTFPIFCDDNCTVKCHICPTQPSPLPRCGKTGIPCPEDPDDKPILSDITNPLSAHCNATECPILCEQCPPDITPLPKCQGDSTPCRDGVLPSCEDNSAGFDNLCDNGAKPICSDLCNAECDHCEAILDPLPKCGQYTNGEHARKPCKDGSDAVNDRCDDRCKESCEPCAARPDVLPMCGKNPDNTDILQVCLDGTLGSNLTNEGLCQDGCALRCEKCVDLQDPLPKCGQFVNGTSKRVRCEDGSDETLTADGDCADTCQPTCDYCTEITIPQPNCGRKPDGTQLNYECSDNLPVGSDGLCSDGCAPLCIPCPDIVSSYIVCEAEQDDCEDESDAFCTIGETRPAPVIWQSSQLEGNTVCSDGTQPRCEDLCTPVCIKATCEACDKSKSFLKVEDFDQHINGYPTQQIIQTNGLPIHPMEPYPVGGWPSETKITNIIEINGYTDQDFAAASSGSCPFCTKFQLPKYAEKGTQFWQLQSDIDVGISTFTGAYLYNHYHGTDDVAVSEYGQTLDFCSGHASNECVYHYHAYPSCVEGYVGNCGLIGYLYDGLPVISTCTIAGTELRSCYVLTDGETGTKTSHYTYNEDAPNCNLDMANGYTFTQTEIDWLTSRGTPISAIKNFNGYAYVMTKNYPWMIPGFYGTQWGGFGCPKGYTNDWTPQGTCVEISPLCVELVKRTPQECNCTGDSTFCVETGYDTAVQYYNRRPPIVSKVLFTSSQNIINTDSTLQVLIQVSKPLIKNKSPLVLNWYNEDADNQLMTFYYTTESTLSDGVTKQYVYTIKGSDLSNIPIDGAKVLQIHTSSGVEDEFEQRVSFISSTTFIFENSCMPDYNAEAYNIDGCASIGGAPIRISNCNVDCFEGGYAFVNKSTSKICRTNGGTFEFIGCSPRCIAPSVSLAYNLENCDTSSGGLSEGACQLSCNEGFTQNGELRAHCPGNGQVFTFTGCNAQCKIDATLNNAAYNLNLCQHNGGLIGNCQVSCAPNYDGNPIIACEEGGQPWVIITGECKPQCIAPTTPGYTLQAPATQEKAVLTCANGYELSSSSNAVAPIFSCPGPGLPFIVSGCGIACKPDGFDNTLDTSGCVGNPLVRKDECSLACTDGYGACTGTTCQNPQPICNNAGGTMGQTMQCKPSCRLPNDPDFLAKYDLTNCPGPVYTSESCQLSCAGGFSSNGQITTACTIPNGVIQITNECSSACSLGVTPPEYDLSECVVPAGGAITEYECKPKCKTGFVPGPNGVKAKCNLNNLKFTFSGCSSSDCSNTPSITCDDSIACTQDICAPGSIVYDAQYASSTKAGCFNIPKNDLCEDGFGCTLNTCEPGETGADANGCKIKLEDSKCDDGIACTTEVCSPFDETATSAGCVFTANSTKCDDNTVCTVDTCEIGQGCINEIITCDDDIFCSIDSCDPVLGCVATPNDNLCTDEWPCTTDTCNIAEGGCVHVPDNSMCIDDYECTIDTCALGANANQDGCTHELNNTVCDDSATCSTNVCAPLSSEDATGCYNTFDDAPCDDGIPCTRDSCSPTHENATTDSGCLHVDICGVVDPSCTLDLEVNEEGIVIKPYIPCVEGKTFANCETVAVTLSQRKEEIAVREKTEIEAYLESIKDNPPSVCNPNPCLGTNSTCEIIVNETSNATRFNCTCPEGQKGDRCEMLAVSEDTKAPAHYAFVIILILGCIMGGFMLINFIQQWLNDKKELKNLKKPLLK